VSTSIHVSSIFIFSGRPALRLTKEEIKEYKKYLVGVTKYD